jgi:hypothetical protein
MNKHGDTAGGILILRPGVVLDYESGTWEQLEETCRRCGLHENFLPDLYLHSVWWVSDILAEAPVTT